jgi:hypothetical protein
MTVAGRCRQNRQAVVARRLEGSIPSPLRSRFSASAVQVWSPEVMDQRDRNRNSAPGQTRPHTPPRRGAHPVLALQRLIGNRGTTKVLARQKAGSKGTFPNSVQVGKLGPIEITESNIADWTGKKNPVDLILTTTKGKKHSDELKRMADAKTKIDKIVVQTLTGENSWIKITFTNARIKGYTSDAEGKTEQWRAVDFDGAHIERISIGKQRP